jgi:hypothetical protein
MDSTIRFLSSLRFMVYTTITLVVLLLIGAIMGHQETWFMVMRSDLNQTDILDWLWYKHSDYPIVAVWLIAVLLAAVALFINLCLGTSRTLWKRLQNKKSAMNTCLFIIHIVFGILMLLHGLSFISTYKKSYTVKAGDSITLPNNDQIFINEIHLKDADKFLNKGRHGRLAGEYDWKSNYVNLSSNQGEKNARHMYPAIFDHYQVNVFRFRDLNSKAMGGHHHGKEDHHTEQAETQPKSPQKIKPAVDIIVTKSYLPIPFILCYLVLIVTLLLYLQITWKSKRIEAQ